MKKKEIFNLIIAMEIRKDGIGVETEGTMSRAISELLSNDDKVAISELSDKISDIINGVIKRETGENATHESETYTQEEIDIINNMPKSRRECFDSMSEEGKREALEFEKTIIGMSKEEQVLMALKKLIDLGK